MEALVQQHSWWRHNDKASFESAGWSTRLMRIGVADQIGDVYRTVSLEVVLSEIERRKQWSEAE